MHGEDSAIALTQGVRIQRARGAVMFADLHGFSALSARYARSGKDGMDRLGNLLTPAIGGLIAHVEGRGGRIVSFAGDALLAFWEEDSLNPKRCAEAAAQTALLAATTHQTLAFKVGVAYGRISLIHLTDQHQLPIGPAIQEACNIEHMAGPGQVLVTPCIWARLEDPVGSPHVKGGWELHDIPAQDEVCTITPEQEVWSAEIQSASVVLAQLPHAEDHPSQLSMLLSRIQGEAESLGGNLNNVSMDDKGVVVLCAFVGLPDGADRAVQLGLSLHSLAQHHFHNVGIGITTGPCFLGHMISRPQASAELIGDAVNRAARLATAGVGIRCDTDIATQCRKTRMVQQAPIRIKGQEAPLDIWTPASLRGPAQRMIAPPTEPSPEARVVLKALSVWEQGTTEAALQATLPVHGINLDCALDELVLRGAVVRGPSGVRFGDLGERRQLYRSLLLEQKKVLHRAAAQWLRKENHALEAVEHLVAANEVAEASIWLEDDIQKNIEKPAYTLKRVERLLGLRAEVSPRILRLAAQVFLMVGDRERVKKLLSSLEPREDSWFELGMGCLGSWLGRVLRQEAAADAAETARLRGRLAVQEKRTFAAWYWRFRSWCEGG